MSRRFAWTEQTRNAASLLAQASMTRVQVAARLGVDERTVRRWLERDEFRARVDEIGAEIAAEVKRIGVATVIGRVRAMNDRWERMRLVIDERGAEPGMANVPGGSSGLLVRKLKRVSVENDEDEGKKTRTIEVCEYEVDTGLLRELREIEKQAAQELGQWQIKVEVAEGEAQPANPVAAAAALRAANIADRDEREADEAA